MTNMTVLMNDDNTTIQIICPFCGKVNEITVPTDDFIDWQCGELIQNAMPYLTPENREFLISGMCRECQDKIFGGDEE